MILLGSFQRKHDKESLTHISKHPNNYEEMVSRNMKVKGAAIRAQKEVRNILQEIEEKGIPMIEQQRAW